MQALYDRIGGTYATTRRADPAIAKALARALGLAPGGAYLDLACGTGNYTLALSRLGGTWTAIDVSIRMLRQARPQSDDIAWVLAGAQALPFADTAFDGAICTLAIHHFARLEAPLAEVHRTLRPGAPFVIFTGLAEQMRQYWLCHYFPEMMPPSIARMPTGPRLSEALRQAGFDAITVTPISVTDSLQDLFLYSGKHRPALYLDGAIRANISSFANLAPPDELRSGLERLAADLDRGAFAAVQARYATDAGDYAFITARSSANG